MYICLPVSRSVRSVKKPFGRSPVFGRPCDITIRRVDRLDSVIDWRAATETRRNDIIGLFFFFPEDIVPRTTRSRLVRIEFSPPRALRRSHVPAYTRYNIPQIVRDNVYRNIRFEENPAPVTFVRLLFSDVRGNRPLLSVFDRPNLGRDMRVGGGARNIINKTKGQPSRLRVLSRPRIRANGKPVARDSTTMVILAFSFDRRPTCCRLRIKSNIC